MTPPHNGTVTHSHGHASAPVSFNTINKMPINITNTTPAGLLS